MHRYRKQQSMKNSEYKILSQNSTCAEVAFSNSCNSVNMKICKIHENLKNSWKIVKFMKICKISEKLKNSWKIVKFIIFKCFFSSSNSKNVAHSYDIFSYFFEFFWPMEKRPGMAPNRARRIFSLLIQTLPFFWAERIWTLRILFLYSSDPTFLDIQVPRSPNSQISRFPDYIPWSTNP